MKHSVPAGDHRHLVTGRGDHDRMATGGLYKVDVAPFGAQGPVLALSRNPRGRGLSSCVPGYTHRCMFSVVIATHVLQIA